MDLLMGQFNNGHMAPHMVKQILGQEDYDLYWEKTLKSKFKEDDNGSFFNERLENETLKRKTWVESRKKNLSHMAPHMAPHMDAHMENVNGTVNGTVSIHNVNTAKVAEIYNLYPSKRSSGSSTGKSPSDKVKISRLLKTGIDLKTLIELYIKKQDPGYYKALKTFLSNPPDRDELLKASDWVDQKETDKPKIRSI